MYRGSTEPLEYNETWFVENFREMLEIFVFECLIKISRKRFIENLETLSLFFFICR